MTVVRYAYPPDVNTSIGYQKYYLLGLAKRARVRFEGAPLPVRVVPTVRAKLSVGYRTAHGRSEAHVGRYSAEIAGRSVRFAIDAYDRREVRDPEALASCDVYFKSNRWPDDDGGEKVRPLVNGNGLLDGPKLRHLRGLRGAKKTVDVAYLSNVWGGREHSLRVFERLAALDCSTDLLAIFPPGFPPGEDAENIERMRAAGVPVTREPLPPRELWSRLSQARVVPLRAGKHLCFSWRTIDLLAMGACVLFDALPPPRWPVPLEAGAQVADCGITRRADTDAGEPAEYDKIAPAVEALLADAARTTALRQAAAAYFDAHAAPERVADYVLRTLARS
jgi:hypothetical protein